MISILQANLSLPPGAAGVPAAPGWDFLPQVLAAGPMVKAVMLVLFAFSLVTWTIIFAKYLQMRRAQKENLEFLRLFWDAGDLAGAYEAAQGMSQCPAAAIFRRAYELLVPAGPAGALQTPAPGPAPGSWPVSEAAPRVIRQALNQEATRLGRSLTFLATCGNTAPFIGLFGTVWGIMTSFHQIGLKGSASLTTVAPGISEALIATAAGLAAAIPAVVAYNYFLSCQRRLEDQLTLFAGDLQHILEAGAARRPRVED